MNGDPQKRALTCAQVLSAYLSRRHPDLVQNMQPILRRLSPCRHGIDFAGVVWYGTHYSFTATQAAIVKLLWEAWETGVYDVRQEALLVEAGSDSSKLADLFRDHPAWGKIIVSKTKGCYRLVKPDQES